MYKIQKKKQQKTKPTHPPPKKNKKKTCCFNKNHADALLIDFGTIVGLGRSTYEYIWKYFYENLFAKTAMP